MTTPTLYAQIKRIADKIVEHYHADITTHDKHALRQLKDGDVALWAAYQCGSHIAILRVGDSAKTMAQALNLFDAQCSVFGGMQWYRLEHKGRHVWKVTESEGREAFTARIKAQRPLWQANAGLAA